MSELAIDNALRCLKAEAGLLEGIDKLQLDQIAETQLDLSAEPRNLGRPEGLQASIVVAVTKLVPAEPTPDPRCRHVDQPRGLTRGVEGRSRASRSCLQSHVDQPPSPFRGTYPAAIAWRTTL